MIDPLPSYAELAGRPEPVRGTAWGLFGEHDELGTLNHLTPARAAAAARLVRSGRSYSLNLPLDAFSPPLIAHRAAVQHEVFGLNAFHRDDRLDSFFPQASSQIDGFRHFAHPDKGFYNGVPGERLIAGTPDLGVQRFAEHGIVGRGVLLDLAAYRAAHGKGFGLTEPARVDVDELDAALAWQGTSLEAGDILLINFGWLERMLSVPADQRPHVVTSPGLAAQERTAAWIWDHRLALVASDNLALEAWPADPSGVPVAAEQRGELERSTHTGMLHRILIPLLGLAIGELWRLDELVAACRAEKRDSFFLVAQPMHVTGGVGSLANARAIL